MTPTRNEEKKYIVMRNHHLKKCIAAIASYYVVQLHQIVFLAIYSWYVDRPLVDSTQKMKYKRRDLLKKLTNSDQFMRTLTSESANVDTIGPEVPFENVDESVSNEVSQHTPERTNVDNITTSRSSGKRKLSTFEEVALTALNNISNKLDDLFNCLKQSNKSMDRYFSPNTQVKEINVGYCHGSCWET